MPGLPSVARRRRRGDGAPEDAGARSGCTRWPALRSSRSPSGITGPYGGRRAFRRSIAAIALMSRVESLFGHREAGSRRRAALVADHGLASLAPANGICPFQGEHLSGGGPTIHVSQLL